MVIKQFTVGCSKTVNLGNFQSIRIEAQLVIEVPEGDDYNTLKMEALDTLTRQLNDTYRKTHKGSDEPA